MENRSDMTREFTLKSLQDITNNFSREHIIGSGGYGVVYKGVLENGEEIAIKKLHFMPGLDDTQFRNEFNNLMRVQHQNITRLVGYCYHIGHECMMYNGEYIFALVEERVLCFEYLQGGSLDKYITDESCGLDWCTRYKIIKGVCEGLNYLHNGYKDPIYHMDLKPANILLDEDMTAKIGDFGLSRLFPSAHTYRTIKIIGTPGYMPPEYIEKYEITSKFDVFSLGVIIIRIIAGDEGYSKRANMSSQQFVKHVHENWRKRMQETMTSHTSLEVMTCIEIALRCVEADRVRRPTISEIVIELNEIYTVDSLPITISQAERELQKGPHENLQGFLDAVDQLRSIERSFSSNSSYSSSDQVLSHVNALLSKALVKVEGEFQNQLSQHSKPMEPDRLFDCLPSTLQPLSESRSDGGSAGAQSENMEAVAYSPPVLIETKFVPLLAKLAQQLVQAGCQQQCAEIYSEARSSALESSLKNLGVEKLSKEEVQKMPWEILESKIGNWIHFMRIAVKLLFAGERQLCDQVFECSQSLRDKCFSAITKNSLATLLSFGEAIAMSKRSPEKLFVLLDMYEIMCELQTEIDTIFVGESCSQMRDSALRLTKGLAQTAQKTFSDFEEAVEKYATKNIHTDGTVHPLTSYVINYVKFLFNYQSTLKQLFQEFKREDGTGSELATVTMSIMQALQNNLDAKAKQYKDPALMHIFLMNNIHYIVKSVRRSEAKDLLGDDWIQRHRRIVQQNANQYRRVAWSKVLQCLSGQGLTSSGGSGQVGTDGGNSSGASRTAVKERFRSFNVLFEEIYQKQCGWSVPDSELRESLRLAVAEILLPAYRSFQKRFGPLIENSKAPGKYVKHTPEQLELFLGNLFEGK